MQFAHDGGEKRAWVLWLALQLGGAMLIRLPGPPYYTVDKFAFLAWIPRAITAGPALAERAHEVVELVPPGPARN